MASQSIKFPIVHELASDDIDSEGLGAVQNPISVTVTSNYDQFPELDLTALWSARNKELLQEDHILIVDAGDGWLKQMFRIVTCEDDWANDQRQILVTAFHIAFDASGNVLLNDVNVANATPQQVWAQLVDALAEPVDITVASSIKDIANVNWDSTQIDSVNSLLFGRNVADQTLTALYDAEWWFDNNKWTLEHHVGRDTGIVIKYGKQLKSLQNTNDFSSIYTAVRPISKYTPGQSGSNGTPQDISGIGLIQYAGTGGVPVYDNPYKGQVATGKLLQNGTRFKISSTVTEGTADGNTWYKVGSNQWIDGEYLSFDKGQTSQFPTTVGNKATGKGTIATGLTDQPGVVETYTGVLTINYVGPGKVAVWNSPWNNKKVTGEYMKTGSSYKVFAKATDMNGKTWYELGTNQWVDNQYVALDKKKDYAYTKTRGAGTVKVDSGKVALWSAPSYNGHIIRYLANKTRWQIYGVATGGDSTWYNLGTNQWIDGQYMDFSSAKDVQPKTDDDSSNTSDSTVDTIYSFNAPGLWNTHVKSYKSGDKVTIYGEGTAGGTTWYNIGQDEWIESDFVTFTNPDDVDPSGSASDTSDQTVTVTLPEKYITVPMPNGKEYEHQRIANFDASSYGINNVDDLRSITQAYIADNNIGKPNFTLTIDYADMAKHYKNLLNVRLYDVVTVFIPEIDLTMKAEVSAVTYDVLLGQNQSVTIGNRPETQSDQLAQWQKDTSDTANQASTTANAASTLASQASDTADAATDTANASAKKIDTVSAQVNAAVAQAQQEAQQAVTDANSAVGTGNKALAQSQTAIDSANKTADDVVATNNNVKQTQSDLQDARTALQSSIADAKANISQAQTDINSMKQDISQNEADLGSAKDDITSAQASISDAQKDITAIKSSVSQNAQDIAAAQGDISDLTTDKSTMSDDIQQIRTNLSTLSKNLNLIGQSITWTTIAVSASAPLDANTYTKQGYYFFNDDTTTSYVKNLPSGMTPYLYLMVQNAAGNVMQEAYKDTSPDRYERVYNASTKTWSQWQKVATESDITDLQGDISMLKQTANNAESDITDIQGNISSIQQSVSKNTSAIADTQGDVSQLQQTAKSLNSTISDMQVGGTNLLANSGDDYNPDISWGTGASIANGVVSTTSTSKQIILSALVSGAYAQIKKGTQVVESLEVKGQGQVNFSFNSGTTWDQPDAPKQNIKSTDWQRIYYVRTLQEDCTSSAVMGYNLYATSGQTIYARRPKLELGNIPTDWSPAPADLATEQSVSALSQRADSIQSTVSTNTGDISALKQTANGLQTTVSNNSGDISTLKQTAKQNSTAIADNAGNITALQQSSTQLKSEVADNTGDISALKQSSTQLSSTISGVSDKVDGIAEKDLLSDSDRNFSNWGIKVGSVSNVYSNGENKLTIKTAAGIEGGMLTLKNLTVGKKYAFTFSYALPLAQSLGNSIAFQIRTDTAQDYSPFHDVYAKSATGQTSYTPIEIDYVATATTMYFSINCAVVTDFITFELDIKDIKNNQILSSADLATEQSVSALSQRADSIQSTVSTNTGDISALKQTANGLQTTVANNSGDISTLKQTSSQLKSELADNANNISQVSQKADSISTTVESVTQEINNIGKYAPNLLLGTSNLIQSGNATGWGDAMQYFTDKTTVFKSGTKMTMRAWISPTYDCGLNAIAYDSNGNMVWLDNMNVLDKKIIPGGQSGYAEVTVVLTTDITGIKVYSSFTTQHSDTTTTFWKEAKLAIWQDPNIPPDMTWIASNADKADVNDVRSQFTQLSNQIGTKVSSTDFESRVTQIDQAIQSKVSSTEYQSEVTQLANELNSKITGGGDVTNIVQNPYFNGGSTKGWSTNITSSTGNTKPGVPYYGHQSSRDAYYGTWFSVAPGETYFFQIFAWPDQSTRQFGIGLAFQNPDNNMTWQQAITYQTTDSGLKSGTLVVPDGYTQAMVWTFINANDTFGDWYFTRVSVSKSAPAGEVYSQIQQLNNNINLRVKAGDLINQINLSTEGMLIAGNKLHITANTDIDNAVITSAMIQSLSASQISAGKIDAKVLLRTYSGADSEHPGGNVVIEAPGGTDINGNSVDSDKGGVSVASSDNKTAWLRPGGLQISSGGTGILDDGDMTVNGTADFNSGGTVNFYGTTSIANKNGLKLVNGSTSATLFFSTSGYKGAGLYLRFADSTHPKGADHWVGG